MSTQKEGGHIDIAVMKSDQAQNHTLEVMGCMFTPQMRTLCALLDLNSVKFIKNETDIFGQGQQNNAGRNDLIQQLYNYPSIKQGDNNVMADTPTLLKYLCNTGALG